MYVVDRMWVNARVCRCVFMCVCSHVLIILRHSQAILESVGFSDGLLKITEGLTNDDEDAHSHMTRVYTCNDNLSWRAYIVAGRYINIQ